MKNKQKQKGVTIIGVLIGITILTIALAAQIKLIANTLKREANLRNLIIGTNLAREGIEIGFLWRNMYGWDTLTKTNSFCSDINLDKDDCAKTLEFGSTGSYHGYTYSSSGTSKYSTAPFKRKIYFDTCNDYDNPDQHTDECLTIVSDVWWDDQYDCTQGYNCVELRKKIYNWYIP